MNLRFAIWPLAALFSAHAATTLNPRKSIAQFHHQVWRTDEGVPHHNVTSVVHSRDGYLWLGTELGLARFDGLRFKVFDQNNTSALGSNLIYSLVEDRQGRLWIGTSGGLACLEDGRFHGYTTRNGLSNDVVLSLYEDRSGTLWIGTLGGGINSFRNGRFRAYTTKDGLPDDAVYAIAEDRNGGLWVGTHGGLCRMAGKRFEVYTTEAGLPNNYIRCLLDDRQGTLWIGTNGGGLARFTNGKFTRFDPKATPIGNSVNALVQDAAGSLWIGTLGAGLVRLAGGKFTSYRSGDGLSDDQIWSLHEGADGSLWIGSAGGLERLTDGAFTTYGSREGLSDNIVLPVYQDRSGDLWIGTQHGGLNRFRDGRFVQLKPGGEPAWNFVMSLCGDLEGNIWAGTRGGLCRFKDGRFTRYTTRDGLPADIIVALHVDRRGTLWAGSGAGLSKFENGRFINYSAKDGLPNEFVKVIEEDHQGNLWIGTGGGGLARFANGRFTAWDKRTGLSNDVVLSIHEDARGTLWIGTNGGGLNRLKNGKITSYSTTQGMPNDTILGILEDNFGNLWLSTDVGVARVSMRSLDDLADGKTRSVATVVYGVADGMRNRECNGGFQPSAWKAADGRLWFPTMNGVTVVDPRTASAPQPPPPVKIEKVLIDRRTVDLQRAVEAPPGQGELEFQYAALGFQSPEKITYRYQLAGFDREWIDAGARRTAYYTNIPPGTYRFEVIARTGDGVWNSAGALVDLRLRPHFYQAPWFYTLCAVLIAGIIAGSHLLYVRRLKAKERTMAQMNELNRGLRNEIVERERVERDLVSARDAAEQANRLQTQFLANMSHEIRTPMNAILGMTELVLAGDLTNEHRANLDVAKASASVLLRMLNDILVLSTIEAGTLQLDMVDFDLPSVAEEALRSVAGSARRKGLRLVCRMKPGVPDIVRGDSARLLQILLKLLENAIKFTAEGQIALEIECVEKLPETFRIHCVVSDTGAGIPPDKQALIFNSFSQADGSTTRKFGGTGLGLAISSSLVSLMHGEMRVESEPGSGSAFHFTVCLNRPVQDRQKAAEVAAGNGGLRDSLRILVVEDNPVNQILMVRLLEKRGHSVSIAGNGREALAAVDGEQFDVVLMDLQMPEMDGLEATEVIRREEQKTGSHLPIIAVTANTMNGERDRCLRAGMDGFLTKPVHAASLFEAVETVLLRDGARA